MKKIFNLKRNKEDKGFAILYAVIVSMIMLAVSIAITRIAVRQTVLSGTGRESQFAFFAANTGIECARYWDLQSSTPDEKISFATSNDSLLRDSADMECDNDVIDNSSDLDLSNSSATTTFEFSIQPDTQEYCINVTVSKFQPNGPNSLGTLITSRGYNVACDEKDLPKAVERGLEMYYEY